MLRIASEIEKILYKFELFEVSRQNYGKRRKEKVKKKKKVDGQKRIAKRKIDSKKEVSLSDFSTLFC